MKKRKKDDLEEEPLLRGGSWLDVQMVARAVYRLNSRPSYRDDGIGFRLIREKSEKSVLLRGGSWFLALVDARAVVRIDDRPAGLGSAVGFRLARRETKK